MGLIVNYQDGHQQVDRKKLAPGAPIRRAKKIKTKKKEI